MFGVEVYEKGNLHTLETRKFFMISTQPQKQFFQLDIAIDEKLFDIRKSVLFSAKES